MRQKAIVPRGRPAVVAEVATWLQVQTRNALVPEGGDGEEEDDDDEWNS